MGVNNIEHIIKQFDINGVLESFEPFGNGHINDTFILKFKTQNETESYVLQRINANVFKKPLDVIHNIELVLNELDSKDSKELRSISAGKNTFYLDDDGNYWRVYNLIKDSISLEVVESEKQASEAAGAYGKFIKDLKEIDPDHLKVIIPNFHDLEFRYSEFDTALEKASIELKIAAAKEIAIVNEAKSILNNMNEELKEADIPVRTTHNDTKLNNVLLDKYTAKARCVIDLDTVMPGYVFNDYGDMIRTFTSPLPEDDPNVKGVYVRKEIFEALTNAFLGLLKGDLTNDEIRTLVLGAKYMVLIIGLRFLTDFLNGNVYFKIKYPEHNLIRARNQFALLQSIIKEEKYMQGVINKFIC